MGLNQQQEPQQLVMIPGAAPWVPSLEPQICGKMESVEKPDSYKKLLGWWNCTPQVSEVSCK